MNSKEIAQALIDLAEKILATRDNTRAERSPYKDRPVTQAGSFMGGFLGAEESDEPCTETGRKE